MEPAFPPVPDFPLLTGRQQSAVLAQLCSAHLHMLFLFLFLASDGPLGSSCFCAGLRQKPRVSKRHEKHHRKLQGSAEGVELYGDKGCNRTDTRGFVMHLVITFIISYVLNLNLYDPSSLPQINLAQILTSLGSVSHEPCDPSIDNSFAGAKSPKCNSSAAVLCVFASSSAPLSKHCCL